mgnify:CR=1 FL=1
MEHTIDVPTKKPRIIKEGTLSLFGIANCPTDPKRAIINKISIWFIFYCFKVLKIVASYPGYLLLLSSLQYRAWDAKENCTWKQG